MKLLENPLVRLGNTVLLCGFTSVVAFAPLSAQSQTSGTLADLVAGQTLTIGDKTFSGFGWTATGDNTSVQNALNAQAAGLNVSVSILSGVYYLDFSGGIAVNNLSGANPLLGNLKLSYTVTANPGLISMIDQQYTHNAIPGLPGNQITIAETVKNSSFTVVANSTLTLNPLDLSDPGVEVGDNLNISPAEHQLFVLKDISITAAAGQLVGLSDVKQSFHQVPEPSSALLGLGGGLLFFLKSRRQARRD